MILYNLLSFNRLIEDYCGYNNYLTFIFYKRRAKSTDIHNLVSLKYTNSSFITALKSSNYTNNYVGDLLKIKKYNTFISRNFWQKFVNKYWQETIFISTSNYLSEKYINKLKSSGLSVYKGNDYKNFLLRFSQDLLDRKILVSIQNKNHKDISLLVNKNSTYVRYKWFKFINLDAIPLSFNKESLQNRVNIDNKRLKCNTLPLFTIINSKDQILMSESSNKLFINKSFVGLLSKWFSNLFRIECPQKIYTGLLFVSPEDALEYKQYIQHQYSKSTRATSVQSAITNLDLYYQLLNSSVNSSEFRLIPDLREVSELIYRYRNYKHLSFDSSQKYGSNYFQGQPIYLIKPFTVKNKNTNQKQTVDYSHFFYKKNFQNKYQVVFLNYQTAIKAWNKFRQKHSYYDLPLKPELYVSNLELFVKKSCYQKTDDQIIFIPSFQAYKFVKESMQLKIKSHASMKQILLNKSLYLKTLLSKILWSLTSRQPINW